MLAMSGVRAEGPKDGGGREDSIGKVAEKVGEGR